MALMTEERRKEMEEEMNRFELEIAGPGEPKVSTPQPEVINRPSLKPLSPPPPPLAPLAVSVLIPEVLAAPPPPPPPPLSPPIHSVLRPPPPPPILQPRPPVAPTIRFIPHQLQRAPPRPPPMRQNYMPMRPMGGHFPPPGPMGPFGPPMGSGPPMGAPHMHSVGPMHHMPQMSQCPPQLPPQMGVSLPAPPGFGPPSINSNMHSEAQSFSSIPQPYDVNTSTSTTSTSSENPSVVASAPAIYAAPFMKSHSDLLSEAISAFNGREHSANTISTSGIQKTDKQSAKTHEESPACPTVPTSVSTEETVVSKKKEKKKKIVRMAGGQAWEDNSLLDWETDDFRIFCGDLGNDVTDEVLIRAFSKYTSFVKAKVIRDKRTNKTKGYGFVSFKDPQDFIKAMREMNGRYVGSRPIKLRKSTWRDRNIDLVKKKQREKEKLGLL